MKAQGNWLADAVTYAASGMDRAERGDDVLARKFLAIVGELVQAHRGTIEVRSTREEGTAFTMRFPAFGSPAAAVLCLLLITAGTILFSLSDFLDQGWLGLPAMVVWMWAAQLGAQRHMANRQHGLDLFTEVIYVLGFDDKLDQIRGNVGQDVADIIDLQSARRRVERTVLRDGTTGTATTDSSETEPADRGSSGA